MGSPNELMLCRSERVQPEGCGPPYLRSALALDAVSGEPAARDEFLASEQAEAEVVGRGVLGVVLEAVALEILDGVGLAIGRANLRELLGGGEAVDRKAAI